MREIRSRKVLDDEGIGASPVRRGEDPVGDAVTNGILTVANVLIPGSKAALLKLDASVQAGIDADERARLAEQRTLIDYIDQATHSVEDSLNEALGRKTSTRQPKRANWAILFAGEDWAPK